MLGFNSDVYKIRASEFEKFKAEYKAMAEENAVLKDRLENSKFENLLEEINNLRKATELLRIKNQEKDQEIFKLNETINKERHTARLVLNKLQEVTDIYARSQRSAKTQYITSLDLMA